MNKDFCGAIANIGDAFAMELQNMRQMGKIDDEQPLIKVDYQEEASKAPFQFDIANSLLHRTDCSIIGNDKSTALYGVWEPKDEDFDLACKKCRPVPINTEDNLKRDSKPLDIVFGFISFIDQFGSVFIERGKEYRKTERGRQISKSIEKLFKELDHQQSEGLNLIISSVDGLVKTFQGMTEELQSEKEINNKKTKNSSTKKGKIKKTERTKKA